MISIQSYIEVLDNGACAKVNTPRNELRENVIFILQRKPDREWESNAYVADTTPDTGIDKTVKSDHAN